MLVTTREGGSSAAPFAFFNLGAHVGDDPAAVARNRAALAAALGLPPDRVVWMDQVHGCVVRTVDGPQVAAVPGTDALVTAADGLALAVLTADCVPVLLSDPRAGVLGAAHAGRLGAAGGVAAATLAAMVRAGARAEAVSAYLGPAACGLCYEVPAAMREEVQAALPGSASTTRAGTPALDLRAGLARQLRGLGVAQVVVDPRCTIEDEGLFSHRRGAPTGRFASVVWMPGAR